MLFPLESTSLFFLSACCIHARKPLPQSMVSLLSKLASRSLFSMEKPYKAHLRRPHEQYFCTQFFWGTTTSRFWPFGVQFPESKRGAFADFDSPGGKFAIASLEGVDRGLNLEKRGRHAWGWVGTAIRGHYGFGQGARRAVLRCCSSRCRLAIWLVPSK